MTTAWPSVRMSATAPSPSNVSTTRPAPSAVRRKSTLVMAEPPPTRLAGSAARPGVTPACVAVEPPGATVMTKLLPSPRVSYEAVRNRSTMTRVRPDASTALTALVAPLPIAMRRSLRRLVVFGRSIAMRGGSSVVKAWAPCTGCAMWSVICTLPSEAGA
jgi:hypothetical protein